MTDNIKISDLLNSKTFEKHQSELVRYFEDGGTWKELLSFDENTLATQYKIAYDLYQSAQFEKASAAFSYLTILNPYEFSYWMGLAVSKQSGRAYEEAIVAYTIADAIQPENPSPHLNLAQCFYALQQRDQTVEHLNQAIAVAGNHPEYRDIKRKATALLQNLPK
jgi:type III secretion system low calcium response chaperone LcrH/SycD